jgi:hypothetical protein
VGSGEVRVQGERRGAFEGVAGDGLAGFLTPSTAVLGVVMREQHAP